MFCYIVQILLSSKILVKIFGSGIVYIPLFIFNLSVNCKGDAAVTDIYLSESYIWLARAFAQSYYIEIELFIVECLRSFIMRIEQDGAFSRRILLCWSCHVSYQWDWSVITFLPILYVLHVTRYTQQRPMASHDNMREIWPISEKGHISLLVSFRHVWGSVTIEQLLCRKTKGQNKKKQNFSIYITTQRQPIKWILVHLCIYLMIVDKDEDDDYYLQRRNANGESMVFTLLRFIIFDVRIFILLLFDSFSLGNEEWILAFGSRHSELECIGLFCLMDKMICFFVNISSNVFRGKGASKKWNRRTDPLVSSQLSHKSKSKSQKTSNHRSWTRWSQWRKKIWKWNKSENCETKWNWNDPIR